MVKKEFLLSPWAIVCKLKVSMSDHAGFFYLSRLHVFHLLSTMPSPTSFSLSSMPRTVIRILAENTVWRGFLWEYSLTGILLRTYPDGDFAENTTLSACCLHSVVFVVIMLTVFVWFLQDCKMCWMASSEILYGAPIQYLLCRQVYCLQNSFYMAMLLNGRQP